MANDLTNTIMRTVSFVERIEVEFHGNVITQAMVLEDVDNDMGNELIVGNIDGEISIFKGDSPQAWRRAAVSGMLTCLAVGKIHLPKKNSLVCMTAEGWCHLFDVTTHPSTQSVLASDDDADSKLIKPVFSQELPANAKVMCLADIDSDGHVEMVIGYSDRVVRAFRWYDIPNSDTGHFLLLQKWQLAGQIGSITINYDRDHQPQLMVSQPGATFVTLQVKPAFRHIKSESYLDKMVGSNPNTKCNLESSGSFATGLFKGSDSPRGDNHGVRKSELSASKSDIFASSSAGRIIEGSPAPHTAITASEVYSPRKEQRLRASREALGMVELAGSGKEKADAAVTSPAATPSHAAVRACKSESYADQVVDPTLYLSGGLAGAAAVGNMSNVGGVVMRSAVDKASTGAGGGTPVWLPLAQKTSVDGLDTGDLVSEVVQGSPQRSNTANSSPRDSQEAGLDRSLGKMSYNLDGSFDDDVFKPSIIYHPLALMQMRNKDTSTVIIGGINRGRPSQSSSGCSDTSKARATYYALATLDGSLLLVENDSIIWSLQVDHYLFALSKLDVTGNGKEEVVCCSWNGFTYIINHSKEVVRYHFPDGVAAFCAGFFSLRDGYNSPCFVYATFNNRIYIYPNITLPRVESTNLLKVMGRMKESQEMLRRLNLQEDDVDSIRSLYYYCLYGQPNKR